MSTLEVDTPPGTPSGPAPAVVARGVGKMFASRAGEVIALDGIDLTVAAGEFVSLIGPSGCGKSTLLRLVADLDQPTSGDLAVFGKSAQAAREAQDYGIAFQQAGLLPWRTVARQRRAAARAARRRQEGARARGRPSCSRSSGSTDFAGHFPHQLSGGMQQRVAIARALAERAEPAAHGRAVRRARRDDARAHADRARADLRARRGAAVVFVTHSIPEAVFLSDRVVVMSPRPGRITAVVPVTGRAGGPRRRACARTPRSSRRSPRCARRCTAAAPIGATVAGRAARACDGARPRGGGPR